MSPESTGLAREFQPVEDQTEALRMLRDAARTIAATMVWTAKQDHVIHSHISLLSDVDKHLLVRKPKDFDIRAFESELSLKGTAEVFFSISLMSANIFFKTKYIGQEPEELAFALPALIYKVQRRQNLRFPIPDGRVLHMSHVDIIDPTGIKTRKVLDISAGGLCFLIPPEEAATFTKDAIIHNLTFSLNHRRITVDAVVRHIGPLPELKRKASQHRAHRDFFRIGVEFTGMRPADNHAVAAYVFEESRKFFTRFA